MYRQRGKIEDQDRDLCLYRAYLSGLTNHLDGETLRKVVNEPHRHRFDIT